MKCQGLTLLDLQWMVCHRQLKGDNSSLMRPKGVHLNDIDIFLSILHKM